MPHFTKRQVIINADDLGYSAAVNTGIIEAYLAGVLSSASLMMGGDAVQEAIVMAKAHPRLAVGLHVSFSDVKPISPLNKIPMLLQDGRFPPDERALSFALRSSEGRQQIRDEISAQFHAFHETGLICDHVNAHRNIHLHPVLAVMLFQETARWRITATRIPWDPPATMNITNVARFIRVLALRRLASMYKLKAPKLSIGRVWDATLLAEVLSTLPQGITEVYCHPIHTYSAHMFAGDLPSLLDANVKNALVGLTVCNHQTALIS